MDMIWIVMSAVLAIAFGYILYTTLSDKLAGSGKAIEGLTDCGSGLVTGIIYGDNTVHGACGGPLKDCEDAKTSLTSTLGSFPDGARMQYVGEGWGCPPKESPERKYCCIVLGGNENAVSASQITTKCPNGAGECKDKTIGVKFKNSVGACQVCEKDVASGSCNAKSATGC